MEVGATIVPHIASTLWASLASTYEVEVSSGYMSEDTITVTHDGFPDTRVVIEADSNGYAVLYAEVQMRDDGTDSWYSIPIKGFSEYFDLTGLDEDECDALIEGELSQWVTDKL